ncbi:RNA polymerase sigma factor [Mucilaginibacter paludis]|uniref:RNA polymerase, sigma-24 subunit, ECF subfamily n=1 Tax=Mucilaginibacter paludis DSM 18603 TaxID=714943 RepID=H1Y3Z2_9SPHI|nr:sigma-70 family RNA polymerase sigma factor [Mucilaginibacter paludis]EHQ30937.1 RNA polymerase, sigma-24 subunit, ECF subfamily [Mucilaginibacter paludis DSM 18603]
MADYSILSDNELIDLLKESDHVAFTEIYRRYAYLLLVHAYKKLQYEEQAKDVIQDLFTSLWLKRDIVIADGNLAGYLYISMRNKILNLLARQKVESKYIHSLNNYIVTNSNSSTDHLVREKELKAYIHKEIQALPRKMRVVFELSRNEQLNNREIALRLDTTENNVSKQVNRALRILKAKLGVIIFIYLLIRP